MKTSKCEKNTAAAAVATTAAEGSAVLDLGEDAQDGFVVLTSSTDDADSEHPSAAPAGAAGRNVPFVTGTFQAVG